MKAVALMALFASFLTGCTETVHRQAPPNVDRISMPMPLIPVATASKSVPLAAKPTTGLKNPGAEPGQTFANGGATDCGYRWTTKGWLMTCPAPNDGTPEFDIRNPTAGL